jgi:hypothetical protein
MRALSGGGGRVAAVAILERHVNRGKSKEKEATKKTKKRTTDETKPARERNETGSRTERAHVA